MNIKKQLGKKIKRMRKNRGLTQENLAEFVDISPRTMAGIELGQNFVTAETLEKIMRALDVDFEELFSLGHLKSNDELLKDIYVFLSKLSKNQEKLEIIHKFLKSLLIE